MNADRIYAVLWETLRPFEIGLDIDRQTALDGLLDGVSQKLAAEVQAEVDARVATALEKAAPLICHMAWCSYQLGAGQVYNEQPTEAQLDSHRNALIAFSRNPSMTAEQNHDNWMQYRLSQGWKYGPAKDEVAKTHPDLVPFNELPEVERNKDVMDLIARRVCASLADPNALKAHDAALRARQLELQDEIDVFVRKQAELREQLTHLQTGCAEWKGKAKKLEAENAGLRDRFHKAMKKAGVQGLVIAKVFALLTVRHSHD